MFDFLFQKSNKNKKLGLVLGGGGARGFYHIGVIKALRELNIEIGEIAGTSMGAIIGAVYCNNPDIDFDKFVDDFNISEFIKFLKIGDFSDNKKFLKDVYSLLKKYVKATNFSDLKIPLSFDATNIDTCKSVVFRKGKIFPGLIASMTLVGMMPPTIVPGKLKNIFTNILYSFFPKFNHIYFKNGQRLVDGGVLSIAPILNIKKDYNLLVSDVSIGVEDDRNLADTLVGISSIPQRRFFLEDLKILKKTQKKYFILRLNAYAPVMDFRKNTLQNLIEMGYDETMKNKKKILNLVK